MNYTSLKQSKKLIELGLNPNTADMFIDEELSNIPVITPYQDGKYPISYWKDYPQLRKRIPCWSVSALLDLMPDEIYPENEKLTHKGYWPILEKFHESWDGNDLGSSYYMQYKSTNSILKGFLNIDQLTVCYDMVVWLLENKYI